MFLAKFSALCFFIVQSKAVPPEECFANFRWDDCGQTPEPVIYYWKPGSRCEVGTWRGCLPNPNMFKNEYECIKTCIFDNDLLQEPVEKNTDETPLHNETTSLEETLPSNVTAAADETSLSNVTMVPDDSLQSTATVDGETLAPNVDDPDDPAGSNKPPAQEDKPNKQEKDDDDSLQSTATVDGETLAPNVDDPDDPAGSNNTPAQEDKPNKQEKDDNKPEETTTQAGRDRANEPEKDDYTPDAEEKPIGRSRLASFLKGK